jgi:FlaA1/EpsC-like NDP-sugar epimerase
MQQNPQLGHRIVGFIDDDRLKIDTLISGHKVLGPMSELPRVVKKSGAQQAIISIAAISGPAMRAIVHACEAVNLPVKVIPGIHEIIAGHVSLSRIREVTIEDLLGRDVVVLDTTSLQAALSGKVALVTGAGGSIGSELCRQIGRFAPSRIVLVEQAENALYQIHRELSVMFRDIPVVPCIADVCDATRIDEVFSRWKPDTVFHAAAHKHVPMMEWNPGEAIKNNVFGTRTVVDASDLHGVAEFVMISTDKAVNPTSVMGATKRCAELYVQAKSRASKTKFVAVRFGNVLGSAGSVIPLFKEQIAAGGPVTVTHPEMKRYFMTIPEACQLVMQAATLGDSGDIFVLDMGEPVRIADLARDLIRLSGMTESDIRIAYTGLRPGEKLFEELSTSGENMTKTKHPKIFIGRIAAVPLAEVTAGYARLHTISNSSSVAEVRAALGAMVPEMRDPD